MEKESSELIYVSLCCGKSCSSVFVLECWCWGSAGGSFMMSLSLLRLSLFHPNVVVRSMIHQLFMCRLNTGELGVFLVPKNSRRVIRKIKPPIHQRRWFILNPSFSLPSPFSETEFTRVGLESLDKEWDRKRTRYKTGVCFVITFKDGEKLRWWNVFRQFSGKEREKLPPFPHSHAL